MILFIFPFMLNGCTETYMYTYTYKRTSNHTHTRDSLHTRVTVYFLGGPAVGNLGRGFWNWLGSSPGMTNGDDTNGSTDRSLSSSGTFSATTAVAGGTGAIATPCPACNDSRAVGCPNCDAEGYYISYGQTVKCNCCKGRGLVMCRECFSRYDEDPYDIDAIREKMSKLPD